jgi:hypothetical protein
MIVTVTQYTTCPDTSPSSHVVGYRVEHDATDSSGMGFPLYQDFESHIPRSLVSSGASEKDIVRLGLDLINAKIEAFVHGTQCNMGSSITGVVGETFQYPLGGSTAATKDDPPPTTMESILSWLKNTPKKSMESVLTFLNKMASDTITTEKRRALLTYATGTGLLTPTGRSSWYSFSDTHTTCHVAIDMDNTDDTTDSSRCPPICVLARALDGAFTMVLETATETVYLIPPSSVREATAAFETGLSTREQELLESMCRHMPITVIDVLYHQPKYLKDDVQHAFRVALESFMTRVRTRPGMTYRDVEVWKDLLDMYATRL